MNDLLTTLGSETVQQWIKALFALVVGSSIAFVVARQVSRFKLHPQQQLLVRRFLIGAIIGISIAWALSELGLNLGVLLGAAGVFTVALGFAAQTSVSNLVSGVFLMAEQPFVVGDVIEVDGTTGEVLSVDFISTKLRTFQNVLVRIPNEAMLKSKVSNLTHFPIRRYDLQVGVAYKEDLSKVTALLMQAAEETRSCLRNPQPLIIYQGFGDSSINLQLSVWSRRESLLELRNTIHETVKRLFDEAGVEIPFPHRTLYTGSQTAPLPVQITPGS